MSFASANPNHIRVWVEVDGQREEITVKDISVASDRLGMNEVQIRGYIRPYMGYASPPSFDPLAYPYDLARDQYGPIKASWTPDDAPTEEMRRKNKKT